MKFLILFVTMVSVVAISSCRKDVAPAPTCVEEISYSAKIQPLMDLNCSTSGCHDANTAQSGVDLSNYAGVNANATGVLTVIQLEEGNPGLMPLGGPRLADSLIQQFSCWIEQGKLDN